MSTVAKAWGKSPSELLDLSEEDKADMIAHEETEAEIQAVEARIAEKKAKEAERKGKKKGLLGRFRR